MKRVLCHQKFSESDERGILLTDLFKYDVSEIWISRVVSIVQFHEVWAVWVLESFEHQADNLSITVATCKEKDKLAEDWKVEFGCFLQGHFQQNINTLDQLRIFCFVTQLDSFKNISYLSDIKQVLLISNVFLK